MMLVRANFLSFRFHVFPVRTTVLHKTVTVTRSYKGTLVGGNLECIVDHCCYD